MCVLIKENMEAAETVDGTVVNRQNFHAYCKTHFQKVTGESSPSQSQPFCNPTSSHEHMPIKGIVIHD